MNPKHCMNCDSEAVGEYISENGTHCPLCSTCHEAFELGQVNPSVGFEVY
jgi:hypothetical protein